MFTNVNYPFLVSSFLDFAGHFKSSEHLLWQNMQRFQSIDAISDKLVTAPSVDITDMFQCASLPAGRLACKNTEKCINLTWTAYIFICIFLVNLISVKPRNRMPLDVQT